MATLLHQITIDAPASRIWEMLTTRLGLQAWWDGTVSIAGGDCWRLSSDDLDSPVTLKVVEEEPDKTLEWLCVLGDPDWENTLVLWTLEKAERGFTIRLEHRDWRLNEADLAAENTRWGERLMKLRLQCHHNDDLPVNDDDLSVWT
ncbi:SRPBCC family protein [Saccharospirillum alexandrii]|uniref:SRPBCC family protein n=1 Tax=Saccharospirillum alexandrii TaxID=2448477 RepID=UPI0013DF8DF1|nr:SRPBCC domain-containing protein [Saccharospirillum alexandrii]